jgi:multidrug efflux system membrane fusion protein
MILCKKIFFEVKVINKIKNDPKAKIVAAIIGITFIWMGSSLFKGKEEFEKANISKSILTKSIESEAQVKTQYISFNATSYGGKEVDLVPQVTGIVVKKFVNDGDKLKAGDKILEIKNDDLIKRVEQMENALDSAKLRYKSAVKLSNQKLGSELDLEDAEKNLKAAVADLSAAKIALENSVIVAPFDGIIDTINVREGDLVANVGSGYKLIGRFLDLNAIKAKAYISQYERDKVANSSEALIIKNNSAINGKITFISSSADENTGTFLLKAIADNSVNIADGEAVKLKVRIGDVKCHNIPISTLIIDKNGDLSVKIIEQSKEIKEYKVDLVDEDDKGIWITGLPDKCDIVLMSQAF